MKQTLLTCLLCAVMAASCLAADAPPALHWYTVTLMEGSSSRSFTGSSRTDADQLAANILQPNSFVTLSDLRLYGSHGGRDWEWFADDPGKMYIVGRTVLCFRELPGDPAAQQAQKK